MPSPVSKDLRTLISYRSFLNCDPPEICRIWTSHRDVAGIMQPLSVMLLEAFVLSKPYFDRNGLIVAVDENRPIGFVHAGFGPNSAQNAIDPDVGVICMLVVGPHPEQPKIRRELIERGESYLRGKGAVDLRAGGSYPFSPFYLGLYGGCEMPGILSSDTDTAQSFRQAGYDEIERKMIFERNIDQYRVPVDRKLMQHRRQMQIRPVVSPSSSSWWDACIFGPSDRIRYQLEGKDGGAILGNVSFWDMGPLSTRRPYLSMGMIDLSIDEDRQREGLGTYLVAEAIQHLAESRISLIQAQAARQNTPVARFLEKLGFESVDHGIVFGK